eukprot:6200444-Pleurochrysis_carterae.AAC.1
MASSSLYLFHLGSFSIIFIKSWASNRPYYGRDGGKLQLSEKLSRCAKLLFRVQRSQRCNQNKLRTLAVDLQKSGNIPFVKSALSGLQYDIIIKLLCQPQSTTGVHTEGAISQRWYYP